MQLALEELKNDNDVVVELEGINIIYDSELAIYVEGVVIDYSNNWFNRGFSIKGERTSSC